MSKQGFIYFITNKNNDVKIGFTSQRKNKSPEECIEIRRRQLQTSCADKLRLLYYLEGTMEVEKSIQNFLQIYRQNGEWFDNSDGRISSYIGRKKLELKTLKEMGLIQ